MASPFIGVGEAYVVFGTGWRTCKLELPLMACMLCSVALRPAVVDCGGAVEWEAPACFMRLGMAWRGRVMAMRRNDGSCRRRA